MNFEFGNDLLTKLNNTSIDNTKVLKKKEKEEFFYEWLESRGINLSEMKEILSCDKTQLVISCAGSGKTTMLVFKIIRDYFVGDLEPNLKEVWVCTFLKKGARDVENKLREENLAFYNYCKSKNVKYAPMDIPKGMVSTMHSEFYQRVLELEGRIELIPENKNIQLLAKVLAEKHIKYEGRSSKSDIVKDFTSALSYTRNRLGDDRYKHDLYRKLNLSNDTIEAILMSWKNKRMDQGVVDFEDLQEKVYEECVKAHNKIYLGLITKRYKHIFIDEFQDTSQIQYEIIKLYTEKAKRTVVIGDDDQTIYTWRGSDSNIIKVCFQADYKPEIKHLSTNYRCPSDILDPVARSIVNNKNRLPKSIKASKSGGTFHVDKHNNYKEMGENLIYELKEDYGKKSESAVLCRTNFDALYPALLLAREGTIPFKLSKEGMTLSNDLGNLVLGVIRLFMDKHSASVKRVITAIFPKDIIRAERFYQKLKREDISIWNISANDYASSPITSDFMPLARWVKWREELTEKECLINIYRDIIKITFTNKWEKKGNEAKALQNRSQYNEAAKAVLNTVIDILETSENETIEDIYLEFCDLQDKLKEAQSNPPKNPAVTVATVHEYKGAEVPNVYVWNCTKGMFPHTMGTERLSEAEKEEERRIYYIAGTRAKKKCVIETINFVESPFIAEMYPEKKKHISIRL